MVTPERCLEARHACSVGRRRSLQVGRRGALCSCRAPRRQCWQRRRKCSSKSDVMLLQVTEGLDGDGSCFVREVATSATATASRERGLLFGAFRSPRRGTRAVNIQGFHFYAFTAPHEASMQVAVWRRLGDVVAKGYEPPDAASPCTVRLVEPSESLAPGRRGGPLAELYQRKPFDRDAWLYWESFWVLPWQASLQMRDVKPLLPESLRDGQAAASGVEQGPNLAQALPTQDTGTAKSKADAFADIYRKGVWPGFFSRSGPGSDPFHPMVRVAITALDMAVDMLGCKSILDAACGDAAWLVAHFLCRRPDVYYHGIDIVSHVIKENQQKFPSVRFSVADFSDPSCRHSLPAVDLVFSKETLNHMFVEDAVQALRNIQSTGARHLVTNVHRGSPNNRGASKGHHANYAPYDYALPPFNLRKLCRLVHINQEDWTEYALFALQS
eukprot:TRINITY_DN52669_c0_g1_i1.p1 TRINITY_DN52669_c0_g1~~TRINITY_DN52669_c0_g1_i1.p1  ORF type:complete len:442 (-),score=56.29 TRINITY_DN52669_c0_g1_i1:19-1344(-)